MNRGMDGNRDMDTDPFNVETQAYLDKIWKDVRNI
jgi:hypothetical protein